MKIGILGYGKMGKEIEKILLERNHTVAFKVNRENPIESVDLSSADVAIEFSTPTQVVSHIEKCIDAKLPIVVGTTAWNDSLPMIEEKVKSSNGALLHASNFSIGVNLFFEINRRLAKLMTPQKEYNCYVEEVHHTQKLDAPSGTALSLTNDILSNNQRFKGYSFEEEIKENNIELVAKREEGVPGTHVVQYESDIDLIEIKHVAHNRRGFALGSVVASEWLVGKQGVFTMNDVLKLSK